MFVKVESYLETNGLHRPVDETFLVTLKAEQQQLIFTGLIDGLLVAEGKYCDLLIDSEGKITRALNLSDFVIIPACWWKECKVMLFEKKIVIFDYHGGTESYGFTDIKVGKA